MTATIERLPDLGAYERYTVTVGEVSGEIICHPRFVESSVAEILREIRRALPGE